MSGIVRKRDPWILELDRDCTSVFYRLRKLGVNFCYKKIRHWGLCFDAQCKIRVQHENNLPISNPSLCTKIKEILINCSLSLLGIVFRADWKALGHSDQSSRVRKSCCLSSKYATAIIFKWWASRMVYKLWCNSGELES